MRSGLRSAALALVLLVVVVGGMFVLPGAGLPGGGRVSHAGVNVFIGSATIPVVAPLDASANLWVDTTGGTCSRQSTAGAYVDAAACSSIDAAWDAATSGDTIRMRTGSYGAQTITGNKTQATYVIGGDGGTTTIGTLDTQGDWLELQSVTGSVWDTGTGNTTATVGDNVTLRNVNLDRVWLSGGTNQRWIGGDLGPNSINGVEPIWLDGNNSYQISGTVIEGVEIHDNTLSAAGVAAAWHLEMVRIDGDVLNTTLRGNWLHGNASNTSTVFVTDFPSGGNTPVGLKILNNRFDADANASIHTQDPTITACSGIEIAYNTFKNEAVTWTSCSSFTGTKIVGNLGFKPAGCTSGVTYTKNVWQNSSNAACGTDTWVSGTSNSVSALGLGGDGWQVQTGSVAIDAAEADGASDYCTDSAGLNSLDYFGQVRPVGSACDAGADERD